MPTRPRTGSSSGRSTRRKPTNPTSLPASDRVELTASVVHASLEHARWPLAVGHVQGMPLRGAEGALDRLLHGRLTDRLLVGTYPEMDGDAHFVPAPGESPPGGVILGLGPAGEVTAAKVTRAMMAGVLQWALDQADSLPGRPDQPLRLGVTTTLVGTNPLDGISIQDSLAALVDGVISAEQLIRTSARLRSLVSVDTLEVIELYEDRARTALSLLRALDTATLASPAVVLDVANEVEERGGGVEGAPPAEYSRGSWWRLEALAAQQAPGMPSGYRDLDFTSLGRRARADRLVQRVESATVDGLVRAAISSPRPDPQLGNTLFELLVPHELKPTLLGGENVQLVVDPETAAYPWEALASDPADSPDGVLESRLALRAGFLRQFSERDAREARFAIRRPTGADVLVIANPPAGEAAPDLPGALREGRLVAKILGKHRRDHPPYVVHALMWDDGLPETIGLPPADGAEAWPHIINALYRYEYRIVHVAAHGAYHPDDPSRSGILIGLDRYLTAATIDSMPVVPEMVFLNCCHSGRTGTIGFETLGSSGTAHHLAASVARSLLLLGVRAVVAAGWAVDDEDASNFAGTLYRSLLDDGETFGEAVTAARRAATRTNTWAAYQCYGDPGFRLRSLAAGTDT